jgi:hypothetical protein
VPSLPAAVAALLPAPASAPGSACMPGSSSATASWRTALRQ